LPPTTTTTTAAPTTTATGDVDCVGDCGEFDKFCTDHWAWAHLDATTVVNNNLGGLGPGSGPENIKWQRITRTPGKEGKWIDLTVTADARYKNAHGGHLKDQQSKQGYGKRAAPIPQCASESRQDYCFGHTPASFAKKVNGVLEGKDVATIGALYKGTYTFTYSFTYADGSPAVIDYLPLTFYDLDGDVENAATCDAAGEAVHKPALVEKHVDSRGRTKTYNPAVLKNPVKATCDKSPNECPGALKCSADAYPEEVVKPEDFAKLTDIEQKLAAVTYLFKGQSTFDMTYTTTRQHRIYILRGSNEFICKETGFVPGEHPAAPDVNVDGTTTDEVEHYCGNEATFFDASSLVAGPGGKVVVNDLAGLGPLPASGKWSHIGKAIVYEEITKHDGRKVDLIITSDDAYKNEHTLPRLLQYDHNDGNDADDNGGWGFGGAKFHRRRATKAAPPTTTTSWRNGDAADFMEKYNGAYRSGVVSVGALYPGTYEFTFKFQYHDDGEPAVLDYLPLTFYDLDGKPLGNGKTYEVAESCDAEGVVVFKRSKLKSHKKEGKCCKVEGAEVEMPIPSSWEKLDNDAKAGAATFLFKGKSEFVFKYTLNYQHRVFVMKGSKALACKQ